MRGLCSIKAFLKGEHIYALNIGILRIAALHGGIAFCS